MKRIHVVTALLVVLFQASVAIADSHAVKSIRHDNKPSTATALMTGVGSVVGTAVYAPVKVATAATGLVLGLVVGGVTDGILGTKFARDLIESSVCGDYTLSAEMLRGEEKLCYWYSPGCGPY